MKNPLSGQAPPNRFLCGATKLVRWVVGFGLPATPRHRWLPAWQGLFDECRMRLFC